MSWKKIVSIGWLSTLSLPFLYILVSFPSEIVTIIGMVLALIFGTFAALRFTFWAIEEALK